jgi:hypothetical protein
LKKEEEEEEEEEAEEENKPDAGCIFIRIHPPYCTVPYTSRKCSQKGTLRDSGRILYSSSCTAPPFDVFYTLPRANHTLRRILYSSPHKTPLGHSFYALPRVKHSFGVFYTLRRIDIVQHILYSSLYRCSSPVFYTPRIAN